MFKKMLINRKKNRSDFTAAENSQQYFRGKKLLIIFLQQEKRINFSANCNGIFAAYEKLKELKEFQILCIPIKLLFLLKIHKIFSTYLQTEVHLQRG